MSSGLQPLRGLRCSQARLWHSLLHWGLRTGLRFAGPVFRGCGALRAVLTPSPLRGFDGFGLFRALRAAFVRPAYGDPVFRRFAPPSPSAARCSGAADAFWACPRASSRFAAFACALRVLAPPAASRPPTASGRDGNAFLRFAPTLNSAWSSHTFAPPCANACAVFRPADFASLRVLGAPAASRPPTLASSLVALPASLGLLRPVSATGGGLRAPLRFACAVFRACALRVLGTPALRAFTFLQAFASTVRNRRSATSHRAVFGGPVFRGCALRFAPCARHFNPSGLRRSQARLQLSLLTGLTSRCFAHRARASCAPQKMPEMTYTPSFLIRTLFFRDFVNSLAHFPTIFARFYLTKRRARDKLCFGL